MMFSTSKKILQLMSLVFVVSLSPAAISEAYAEPTAQQFDIILDLSGKQRMLSQKMAKEALLVAKGVDADTNRRNLKATTDLFQKTMTGLKNGDSSLGLPEHEYTRIKQNIDEAQAVYNQISPIYADISAGGTPKASDLALIEDRNTDLLERSERVVMFFELEAKASTGIGNQERTSLLNTAGRQRMLIQKMAKEHLLLKSDVNAEESEMSMYATMLEFQTALKALKDGDAQMGMPNGVKSARVIAQLNTVDGLWNEFKRSLKTAGEADYAKINDLNAQLVKEANKTVQMIVEETAATAPSS